MRSRRICFGGIRPELTDGRRFAFQGQQGEAIGRLGTVEVTVEMVEGRPTIVRVGGCAVIVFKSELVMPDDGHPAFT